MTPDDKACLQQAQHAADNLKVVIRSSKLSPDLKMVLEGDVEWLLQRFDTFMEKLDG